MMMLALQKKLARREATKKVNEVTIRSIVDFMKIFKKALGIEDDFLPLTEDERIVEFGQNVKLGVAYIQIKLNEKENHFVVIIYSGQTSKPITPSDIMREIRTASKWLNKVMKVPTMENTSITYAYIGDRITSNAEKLLKKLFTDQILVLRLRRNEKPIQNVEELKDRLGKLLQRVAKTINKFIGKRTENLIYRLKDQNVKTFEKVASRTQVLIARMYSIYKTLAEKYGLEDKLRALIEDFLGVVNIERAIGEIVR
ncbi:hypothetical protein STSV1pORF68 [Sulfolobus virus STSV1]|uniref:hypothetical protein n=1 Tax=Sulfolobus virus STSV1 TaxID=285013 RepID=UPI000042B132|nr:hypothetical protein STSV1pORF68 [Sulfolobus virus STSV1]CAH04251.1 hypothetical protein [Sulfolobus virus STSV1]